MALFWQRRSATRLVAAAAVALGSLVGGSSADAVIRINEILLDAPGNDRNEYFEIRGTAGSSDSLSDIWFIQLENEQTGSNDPGIVDFVYNLSSHSFSGSNDYLWFAPNNHQYGLSTPDGTYSGNTMENSGGTFLLVDIGADNANPPALDDTWDTNDDGVFDTDWDSDWVVLDAIGIFAEEDDITPSGNDGRLYADINFAAGVFTDISTEGIDHAENGGTAITTTNINTNRSALDGAGAGSSTPGENANAFAEIEYVARYGDTTGFGVNDEDDWIAGNVTDNHPAYSSLLDNWGISGDHVNDEDPEVVRGNRVEAPHAYGHITSGTLGAANSTTYTPEPSSLLLLAMGAFGILGQRRRHQN